jgi:hypothetical protein
MALPQPAGDLGWVGSQVDEESVFVENVQKTRKRGNLADGSQRDQSRSVERDP